MKKLGVMLVAMFLVAGLSSSAFASDPGWGRHGGHDNHGRYERGWNAGYHGHHGDLHHGFRGHERDWRDAGRHHDRHGNGRESGAMISLPLVPVPGISQMFPSINFSIH